MLDTVCYLWYKSKKLDKFKLYIKQGYLIASSVQKIHKVKIQILKDQKLKE